jgi:LPXTG-motif cell wall-anchored protein
VAAPKHRQTREAIVRKSVRKFMGLALLGALGAFFALPMLSAGAQVIPGEGAPPIATCNITSFSPNAPVAAGAFPVGVELDGTVDAAATLTLLGSTPPASPPVMLKQLVVGPGPFAITGQVSGPSTITLGIAYGNENAYTASCLGVGGVTQFTVEAETATRPVEPPAAVPAAEPAAAQALAFTGSSDTPSYVLIGIAAIVVGAVLVVAARRRSHLS